VVTELIVDDTDASTSFTGRWEALLWGEPVQWRARCTPRRSGARFTFAADIAGTSRVSLWWTTTRTRLSDVPVEIYDGDTKLATVTVNQLLDSGKWNDLGSYTFSGKARVVVVSLGGGSTSADAVKFAGSSFGLLSRTNR
jgi:hypothetical protein